MRSAQSEAARTAQWPCGSCWVHEGQISESGPPAELLAAGGLFAGLFGEETVAA